MRAFLKIYKKIVVVFVCVCERECYYNPLIMQGYNTRIWGNINIVICNIHSSHICTLNNCYI